MHPDEIASRFRRTFPKAAFKVRRSNLKNDQKYEIDITDGPLDPADVADFEVLCHLEGFDVMVND